MPRAPKDTLCKRGQSPTGSPQVAVGMRRIDARQTMDGIRLGATRSAEYGSSWIARILSQISSQKVRVAIHTCAGAAMFFLDDSQTGHLCRTWYAVDDCLGILKRDVRSKTCQRRCIDNAVLSLLLDGKFYLHLDVAQKIATAALQARKLKRQRFVVSGAALASYLSLAACYLSIAVTVHDAPRRTCSSVGTFTTNSTSNQKRTFYA